jgi:hypothetical protein
MTTMTDPPHRFVILFSRNFNIGTLFHTKPKRNGQGWAQNNCMGGWHTNDRSYAHLLALAKFVMANRHPNEPPVSEILADLFPGRAAEFDKVLLDLSREALVRAAGGEVDRAV